MFVKEMVWNEGGARKTTKATSFLSSQLAMVWIFMPPPTKIHMLKPNSQCDGIKRWGLWRGLGEISVFIKEAWGCLPLPLLRTKWEDTIYEPENSPSPDTEAAGAMILDPAGSKTVRTKLLLLMNHTVYNILL